MYNMGVDKERAAVFITSERFAPKEEDWVQLQGGKPAVVHVCGELFNIIHNYKDGGGPIVPTFRPEGYGSVRMGMKNGRVCEFPVALVWSLHGRPCEIRGRTSYKRSV